MIKIHVIKNLKGEEEVIRYHFPNCIGQSNIPAFINWVDQSGCVLYLSWRRLWGECFPFRMKRRLRRDLFQSLTMTSPVWLKRTKTKILCEKQITWIKMWDHVGLFFRPKKITGTWGIGGVRTGWTWVFTEVNYFRAKIMWNLLWTKISTCRKPRDIPNEVAVFSNIKSLVSCLFIRF